MINMLRYMASFSNWTDAINQALKDSKANRCESLYFPERIYPIPNPIDDIDDSIRIYGDGGVSASNNGTQLICNFSGPLFRFTGKTPYAGSGGGIYNLSIYKGMNNPANNVNIDGGNAITLSGVNPDHRCGRFKIVDVMITGYGIEDSANWDDGINIDGTQLDPGLIYPGIREVWIRGCDISYCKNCAINAYNPLMLNISDSVVMQGAKNDIPKIIINSGKHVYIRDCTIFGELYLYNTTNFNIECDVTKLIFDEQCKSGFVKAIIEQADIPNVGIQIRNNVSVSMVKRS